MKFYPKMRTAYLLSAVLLLAGCNFGGEDVPEGAPNSNVAEQIKNLTPENELFIYTNWPQIFERPEVFDKQIREPLMRKFPELQIKHVHWDDGRRYEDLLAAETYPDIIMDNARWHLQRYILKYDLQYDLREMIKKHNFDLGRLNAATVEQMSSVTPDGAIYGLPFHVNNWIMFYNIDVFDKFGAEYPRDGITYDEAYELAKKLTRVDGEVTYKGYSQNPGHYMHYNQLSLSGLHQTEDRGDMTSDGWVKLVNNLRRFYEIPANQFDTVEKFPMGNIAMAVATVDKIVDYHEQNPSLNFNITAVPSFAEVPNTQYQPNLYSMYLTKQSNKKDLAFQVMDYLLSEEYWIDISKEAVIGPLVSPEVQSVFGQNLPHMQGKNTQAIFASQNASPPPARAAGLTYVDVYYQTPFQPLIFDESKDTVTALRMTEEQTTKAILTKKAAEGE